jgi:hypothetical protein
MSLHKFCHTNISKYPSHSAGIQHSFFEKYDELFAIKRQHDTMDRDIWAKYLRQYRKTDKREAYNLLKVSGDCVHIPDLMDYLKRFDGKVVLTGDGTGGCQTRDRYRHPGGTRCRFEPRSGRRKAVINHAWLSARRSNRLPLPASLAPCS